MWCLVDKKTGKIKKVYIGKLNYAIGFSSKEALISNAEEYDGNWPQGTEIRKIEFEY
jgi:hypothetical protein